MDFVLSDGRLPAVILLGARNARGAGWGRALGHPNSQLQAIQGKVAGMAMELTLTAAGAKRKAGEGTDEVHQMVIARGLGA